MIQNYKPEPGCCTCCGGWPRQLGDIYSAEFFALAIGGWCADCLAHLVGELKLRLRSEETYVDAIQFVLAVNKRKEGK